MMTKTTQRQIAKLKEKIATATFYRDAAQQRLKWFFDLRHDNPVAQKEYENARKIVEKWNDVIWRLNGDLDAALGYF